MSAVPRRRQLALLAAIGAAASAHPAAAQRIPNSALTGLSQRGGNLLANDFAELDPLGKGAGFNPYADLALRTTFNDGSNQTLFAEFAAGVNAFINRDRAQGTASFRFTYREPLTGRSRSRFFTDGIGRGTVDLARNHLFLDLSAYATVSNRTLGRGFAFNPQDSNGNLSQVYFVSASPRFQHEIGTLAIVNANYRASYTGIDNNIGGGGGLGGSSGATSGGGLNLRPLSDTFSQSETVSLSNQPRDGRFSVSLTGQANNEDQKRLDQNFRSYKGTLDLSYAVSRPVALVGSAGYEDYKSKEDQLLPGPRYLAGTVQTTQDAADPNRAHFLGIGQLLPPISAYFQQGPPQSLPTLLPAGTNYVLNNSPFTSDLADPALDLIVQFDKAGQPIRDPVTNSLVGVPFPIGIGPVVRMGQYVVDRTRPRRITYAQSGFVYNVGLRYTPSRRTLLELRVGQRFSDVTVTGVLSQQFRNGLLITGSATDGIETFSSILTQLR